MPVMVIGTSLSPVRFGRLAGFLFILSMPNTLVFVPFSPECFDPLIRIIFTAIL